MRIVLLGAPGSGKGTQGKFISEKYNIPKISTGDILRENIYSRSQIGTIIKKTMKEGKLVSDKIVCELVIKKIQQNHCINSFLLDGFPRTKEQAHYMFNNKIDIDYVLEFIVPNEIILERTSGRRIHAQSGRIYHIKYNPPKTQDRDDVTGELLIIRDDDQKESLQERLKEYQKTTHELVNYYRCQQKIRNLKYFEINGEESIQIINKKIESIFNQ